MSEFNPLEQDWNTAPFVGMYVRKDGGMGSLSNVQLISHIVDNLYVGGCVGGTDIEDFFDHVFSLYKWESYAVAEGTNHHVYTMYDSTGAVMVMDLDENLLNIQDVAADVAEALKAGGNVLVHCQAGINRSNLTAALALMKRYDMTAEEAIALLREKRSEHVLANSTFERYLRALDSQPVGE